MVSVFQAAGTYLQRGRPDRIFYGWRPVGTSMVTLALLMGSVVMTYTVIGAVSQLLAGVIGDRLPKPPLIAAFVALQGVGVVIAVNITDVTTAFIFAILFGLGIGGRTALLTAIRGDYFGRKSFATILGITQLPMNALWMTAPIIAGYMFDTTGSYTAPFLGVAALNFLAAALILAARKPALPASRSRDDASAQIKQDRQAGQTEV